MKVTVLERGSITSVPGFLSCGIHCGVKAGGKKDLVLIVSEVPAVAWATTTRCQIPGAPIYVVREHLKHPTHRAIVSNSGNSNTISGRRGLRDAYAMAAHAAQALGCDPREVLVASTGPMGVFLPMDKILPGIEAAARALSRDGGDDTAQAMMTTDTVPKQVAVQTRLGGKVVTIGGSAKGAGMIGPNMGTMHCFLATDCAIARPVLRRALIDSVERSFNSITVDGDTSTSDTVAMLANGLAGNRKIASTGSTDYAAFQAALDVVTQTLAQKIARDGEGASKFVTVRVERAASDLDAKKMALTVANSVLTKCSMFGGDPNIGRVAAAAGRSGAKLNPDRFSLWFDRVRMVKNGVAAPFDRRAAFAAVAGHEILIRIDLGLGQGSWTAWTCDLTYEYVRFNAEQET